LQKSEIFQNSFTERFGEKFATKLSLNVPPHRKCVATLPCKLLFLGHGARRQAELWNFRSNVLLLPGTKFHRWNFRSLKLLLPQLK